jgi:hypothetical protein
MKLFISFFLVMSSFTTIASTIDTKTFVYDGSQSTVELVLRTDKTHTEYKVEEVLSTCYRSQVSGYRSICTGTSIGGYGSGPYYPGPHRRQYTSPYAFSRQCYSEPIYRQVPYSCTQTSRLPYPVKDYDVEARVIVDVTKVSTEMTTGETIKVALEGENLVFTASGSKKFFIIKKKQDERSSMNGSIKQIDALLAVELIEAAPVLNAIKVTNIALENSVLNFRVGSAESLANIGFGLKIVKVKFLGSDTVMLNRNLSLADVYVQDSEASVNLSKLGVELTGGKYNLTATTFAKFDGSLMNETQFDDLTASRTLIYKN